MTKNLGSTNGYTTLIHYCNGKFFTQGGDYSYDGINWKSTNISYIPNIYYVPGVGRYFTNIYSNTNTHTSTDGVTWVSIGYKLCEVPTWGNGILVSYTEENMLYSTDGVNWNKSSKVPREVSAAGTMQGYRSITFIKDKFIHSSNELSYSKDGIN